MVTNNDLTTITNGFTILQSIFSRRCEREQRYSGTQGGGQMKQYGSQYLAQQEQSLQSTDETHYYVILQPDFVFIDITVQQLPDQAERIVNDMLFHG